MFEKSFSRVLLSILSVLSLNVGLVANSNMVSACPENMSLSREQEVNSPSRDFFFNYLPVEFHTLNFVVEASNAALALMGLPILTNQEQQSFDSVFARLDRDWANVVVGLFVVTLFM